MFTQPHKTIDDTNAIDLLSAYLNPNIASLKQQLPQCGKPISSTLYSEISPLWSQFHNIKTLPAIETPQAIEALPAINTSSKLISNEELEDGLLATPTSKEVTLDLISNKEISENVIENISEAQIALVKEAEQAFSPIQFSYKPQTFHSSSNINEGSVANARAISTRRRSPPDKLIPKLSLI